MSVAAALGPNPRLAPLLLATLSLGACSDCADEVVGKVAAPAGAVNAVIFRRSCGATTGFSTHISILPAGTAPSGGGNAFVADDDHGQKESTAWGGPWVDVRWAAADRLIVRYDRRSRVFSKKASVSGVRIDYRPIVPARR